MKQLLSQILLGALFIGLSAASEQAPVPERVVVAGGVVAETLCALGLQDKIVAIDQSCMYPQDALGGKPVIGYVRALPAEGILSTKPDALVTTTDAGPPPTLAQLKAAGLRIEQVPVTYTVAGAADRIRSLGQLMGKAEAGNALADQLEKDVAATQKSIPSELKGKRGLYLLHLRPGASLAGGAGTAADALLKLAGCVNAAEAIDGWKPISAEAMVAAAPDFIIVDAGEADGFGGIDKVAAMPGVDLTPAGKNKHVLTTNHGLMLQFGPRLAEAVQTIVLFLQEKSA